MENKEKKLSIIIPVYNSQKTLQRTVNSILQQTGLQYEVILVDDGSNSECAALCDALAWEYKNIQVFHQDNAGSLRARLNGAEKATGQYLMYVDADDFLYEGAFAHIAEDLKAEADLYIYDYDMEEVGGLGVKTIKALEQTVTTSFSGEEKKVVSHVFMKGWINTVCATVFRRELIDAMPFSNIAKKLTDGEDRLQKMFALIRAQKINYVPYAFYHYCWYEDSQGSKLRKGVFSEQLYMQFKETWSIERNHYTDLGFNEDECEQYDLKKLNRICATFEKSYSNKDLSCEEFQKIVAMLSQDTLFKELARESVLSRARKHLRKEVKYILHNQRRALKVYWAICNIIRRVKYGK